MDGVCVYVCIGQESKCTSFSHSIFLLIFTIVTDLLFDTNLTLCYFHLHCVLHTELDCTAEQAFIWLPLVSVIVPSHREDWAFANKNINFKKILVTSLHLKHN